MSTHEYTKIALIIFDARNAEDVSTTYGQALTFVKRGADNLKRFRVKAGEVVVYNVLTRQVPATALVLLSVGAQTTVALLDPGQD